MNAPVTTTEAKQLPIASMGGSIAQAFSTGESFALAYRMAQALAASDMVPKEFKGNPSNCMVALDVANRTGASPFMVMQNLNVIHGRPSWSSQFVIAALNSCGRFTPLRFKLAGSGDARSCYATTTDKATGETLEGPACSIEMAKAEGWYGRTGSKWPNMADLMLTYRAAAFFGRLYAPDVLMGMHTVDELQEIDVTPAGDGAAELPPAASADGIEQLNARAAAKRSRRPKQEQEPKQEAAAASPPAEPTPPAAAAAPAGDPQPPAGAQPPAATNRRAVVTDKGVELFASETEPEIGSEFDHLGTVFRVIEVSAAQITVQAKAPAAAAPAAATGAAPAPTGKDLF